MKWEMQFAKEFDSKIQLLLEEGWEPYAVVMSSAVTCWHYFRRPIKETNE